MPRRTKKPRLRHVLKEDSYTSHSNVALVGKPASLTLPDELWLSIVALSLSECFSPCQSLGLLPRYHEALRLKDMSFHLLLPCHHAIGLCTNRFLLRESKKRVAALAGVNRHLRCLLRPLLFRVILVSDGQPLLAKGSFSECLADDSKAIQAKTKAAMTCKAKVDAISACSDLCAHIRVIFIKSLERWSNYDVDCGTSSRTKVKFVSALRGLYTSTENLLAKLTGVRDICIDHCNLSPDLSRTIHACPSLHSLSFNDWCPRHNFTGDPDDPAPVGPSSLSALRCLIFARTPTPYYEFGIANLQAFKSHGFSDVVEPSRSPAFDKITTLHLIDVRRRLKFMLDSLNTFSSDRSLSQLPQVVFPALQSFQFSETRSYVPPSEDPDALGEPLAKFIAAHSGIKEVHFNNISPSTWARVELNHNSNSHSSPLLPNLVRFHGPLEIATDLARPPNGPITGSAQVAKRNLTEFKIHLDSTHRWGAFTPYFFLIAESTADRLIDLKLTVTAPDFAPPILPASQYASTDGPGDEGNADPFCFLISSLPRNIETLQIVVSVLFTPFPQSEWDVILFHQLIKGILLRRFKHLRCVEIDMWREHALGEDTANSDLKTMMVIRDINMPSPDTQFLLSHPIAMLSSAASEMDNPLRVRGHPCLEKVRIMTAGTWFWSDRLGWEYCV